MSTELALYMSMTDILSIATTNSKFREKFLSKEVNDTLAIKLGFPFNLSLNELKAYEKMTLNERLEIASSLDDIRLVKKLIEMGADNLTVAMKNGMSKGNLEIVEFLLDNFEIFPEDLCYRDLLNLGVEEAIRLGNNEVIKLLLSKNKLTDKDTVLILNLAADYNNVELVKP